MIIGESVYVYRWIWLLCILVKCLVMFGVLNEWSCELYIKCKMHYVLIWFELLGMTTCMLMFNMHVCMKMMMLHDDMGGLWWIVHD